MNDLQEGNNIALLGGPLWTVPELLFESNKLIPALQQMHKKGKPDHSETS